MCGLGGVGKSQLALQYADRNRGRYSLIWWIDAATPETLRNGVADLARGIASGAASSAASRATHEEAVTWTMAWLAAHPGVALLAELTGSPDPEELDALAGELGDLPLALAQAGAYIAHTPGIGARRYRDLLRASPTRMSCWSAPLTPTSWTRPKRSGCWPPSAWSISPVTASPCTGSYRPSRCTSSTTRGGPPTTSTRSPTSPPPYGSSSSWLTCFRSARASGVDHPLTRAELARWSAGSASP
ncbi:hypothetical protein AB0J35_01565 [Nonomuraea angiospora]|uniref:hypothetical protein n=1 Tax=Nonomuraea angiospora TaxID=46172 RepID=UPI003448CD51